MIFQKEITIKPKSRGIHLITDEIISNCREINNFKYGLMNLFIKHTSASLTINENADPTVRYDMEKYFNKIVPESDAKLYQHTYEGLDDMTSHIKSTLIGTNINIPITNGKINLGTWQGIYLCEHRNYGGSRKIIITIIGE
ncbi:MAG: secondary thiamine-phosphate synthase enzyme YjbQ [Melioribacteraceae bacterium]|nr:secondary thiamine-phosphate synthase enzyme YjbQ [Melioribacteraceae bacterium]